MKITSKLGIMMLALFGLNLTLEAKIVKFSVNMKGQTISPSGIHISGDFQTLAGIPGGDWNSATAKLNARKDFPDIYEITVNIPAFRKYEYKFVNGELFYEVEFVPEESRVGHDLVDNRWIYIDSLNNDTTFIGPLLFGGNAPEGKKMVRFRVGMNGYTVDPSGVYVAGSFNGNDFKQARMFSFTGTTYEYMAYVDSLSTITYKYANGNSVDKAENIIGTCTEEGFRTWQIQNDILIDSLCFASCELCKTSGLNPLTALVNFKVYPNPAKEAFVIEWLSNKSQEYAVTDISGRVMLSGMLSPQTENYISREALPNGLYLLKISNLTQKLLLY